MIIKQSIYILSIITKEIGKLKTHSPIYCIMFQQLSEVCNLANDGDFDTFVTLMQHCHGDTEVASIVCNFVKDCFTCS